MYYVYILVCLQTGRSYVGQTDDLLRRFRLHRAGTTRTTRQKLAELVMVHWESCSTRAFAMRRERYYKAGSGHRVKQAIIADRLKLFLKQG
ncbi:MAG TPA: GIY-YIG nuclease family protein [Lacunisphaera sp.]